MIKIELVEDRSQKQAVKSIIEIDDLIQIGMLGLVTAAENFIEKPGVSFSSYAKIRITTHAIEGLSENDFILAAKIDKIVNV